MSIAIKVLQLILSLSILVLVHEFGHYFFARLFKVRVEKFYLFFNPWFSLFKFKKGDTEYGIGWIPFGGYCSISGMIDERMDTEQMKQEPKPYEFRSKPAWQRLLIMLGGVMMNVLLALLIYIGLSYAYGESYVSNRDARWGYEFTEAAREVGFRNGDRIVEIEGVEPSEYDNYRKIAGAILFNDVKYVKVERGGEVVTIPIDTEDISKLIKAGGMLELRAPFVVGEVLPEGAAARAGMLAGDSMVAAEGRPLRFFDEYKEVFLAHKGDTVTLELVRDSAGVEVFRSLRVPVSEDGLIGVSADFSRALGLYNVQTREFTLLESIPEGVSRTGEMLGSYVKQLKMIFNPQTEAYKSVGSIISMGNFFPAHWDWYSFWTITAFFSIILAIMNILPIPGLDGGHVLFLLYEVVTRRKPSDKFMERAQMVGMFILFVIIALALGNDVYRLFK